MNKLWTLALIVTLLVGSAFGALIQSPIPPSSSDNYFLDRDGDGRLDGIALKFLGSMSQDYVNQMVDSLTFDWLDSAGMVTHVNVPKSSFLLVADSDRKLSVDLMDQQRGFAVATSPKVNGLKNVLGNVKLFLAEGSSYTVAMADRMAPVITETVLRGHRGEEPDSLVLQFSESMKVVSNCATFLDYKRLSDGNIFGLPMVAALWNEDASGAVILLDAARGGNDFLAIRDSIRMIQNCIGDSVGNMASGTSGFVAVSGFYPLNIQVMPMAVENNRKPKNTPIFQLLFEKVGSENPDVEKSEESGWGFSMDVMNDEFLNAVRSSLGLSAKAPLDYAKLNIHYSVKIYTNLGSFVVGTSADVKGNDSRFENSGKNLFLKWNMMNVAHRNVGVGVYIANIDAHVTYDGQIIFRNDAQHGSITKIFGVKRR